MNAAQAKRVPLRELLAALGLQPQRQNLAKGELWYLSPFREETSASFKVDEAKNLWYDFGASAGGNVLDFAITYFRVGVAEALRQIDGLVGGPPLPARGVPSSQPPAPAKTSIPTVRPLASRSLLVYLASRGIPGDLAQAQLQELHYRRNGKPYFALAFPNAAGGYELRNPYFKGTWPPKDISQVVGEDPSIVAVFEGFMDFLSALACGILANPRPRVIVLNSVSLRAKAVAALPAEARTVELYFDHDQGGWDLTAYFQTQLPSLTVVDCSDCYAGYKDLNAWAVAQAAEPSPPSVER